MDSAGESLWITAIEAMTKPTPRRHVPGPLSDDVLDTYWERCRAELAAAGLPEHIEDPELLARLARLAYRSARSRARRKAKATPPEAA